MSDTDNYQEQLRGLNKILLIFDRTLFTTMPNIQDIMYIDIKMNEKEIDEHENYSDILFGIDATVSTKNYFSNLMKKDLEIQQGKERQKESIKESRAFFRSGSSTPASWSLLDSSPYNKLSNLSIQRELIVYEATTNFKSQVIEFGKTHMLLCDAKRNDFILFDYNVLCDICHERFRNKLLKIIDITDTTVIDSRSIVRKTIKEMKRITELKGTLFENTINDYKQQEKENMQIIIPIMIIFLILVTVGLLGM